MGGSWSSNKRRNGYVQHPQPPASTPPMTLPPPPPPPPPSSHPLTPSEFASSSSSSSSSAPLQNYNYPPNPNPSSYGYATPYHHPIPPPPPTAYNMYAVPAPAPYYGPTSMYSQCSYFGPQVVNGGGPAPYYLNQYNGWGSFRPPQPHGVVMQQGVAPPNFVEHQKAKKVKNYVNVKKDSVRVEVDGQNPDHFLVSFEFDAEHDGSITVYYFAKVEDDCKITPLFPEAHTPVKVLFKKGPGQKFQQTPGTGIDLGFFELDDLAKPSPTEDIFPLVISAETSVPTDGQPDEQRPLKSPHMQITQAVLLKKETGFQAKVLKQILWIDQVRYELRDIFGIGSSSVAESSNDDAGTECVICLTEPKDTAVLPCRHMCMCSDCARALRFQSDKCPICRQPIEEIMEIKIEKKGN